MSSENAPWIQAQKTTFENWVNDSLKDIDKKISDISSDFNDGVMLYHLYRQLTGNTIKQIDLKPKIKISKLQNLNIIINKFKEDKVKIVNVQGEDIYEKNLKLILGFTWMLIQRYHILGSSDDSRQSMSASPKKILLQFIDEKVKSRTVNNFNTDWVDGDILAELINEIQPGVYPPEDRPSDPLENIEKALNVAKEKMGVPKVIEAKYIKEAVDELSLMTYATYLKKKYEENKSKIAPEKCVAFGPGIGAVKNSESPHTFSVELRNIYGSLCPVLLENSPLKDLDPRFEGPAPVQFNLKNIEPGIYQVEYDAVHPGDYKVAVSIGAGGPAIKDSPFDIKIEETEQTYSGNGLEDGVFQLGEPLEVRIDSGTQDGGMFEAKDIEVHVQAPDGSDVQVEAKDYEDGKYGAFYTPEASGEYTVSIHSWGSPKLVKKVKKTSAAAEAAAKEVGVHLSGELVEKKVIPDNRATGVVVKVAEKNGQPVEDAKVDAILTNKTGEKVGDVEVENKGDGVYEVNIDGVEEKGEYDVEVIVNGESKAKFPVECAEGTQPEMVEGTFTFEVHAKDKHGNPKTFGGDLWEVDIKGPNDAVIEVDKKDLGDGRYNATYKLAAHEGGPSTFVVSAKLDGVHVASSPFKHELAPKPSVGQRLKNFFKRK